MNAHLPIDPEAAAVLQQMPAEYTPRALIDFDDMASTRERTKRFGADTSSAQVAGVRTRVETVPGPEGAPAITLRIHEREDTIGRADRPVFYWTHGGGMVIGSAADDDANLAAYVTATGCVAVSVEYRLAPEHPYPAPQEDVYAGLMWTVSQADALGLDLSRLVIGGASAGGGLTAALAIMVRDRKGPHIALQMLFQPMLDHRNELPSTHEVTDVNIWDGDMNARGWAALLGDLHADDVPGTASPARESDLTGLPPAFIDVGSVEVFRDEAIDYASRLMRSGVQTELHVWPGGFHGYDAFAASSRLARSTQATRHAAIQRVFDPAPELPAATSLTTPER